MERWKKNELVCPVVIFENAGHCVNLDAPQQFHKTLQEFWSKGHTGE